MNEISLLIRYFVYTTRTDNFFDLPFIIYTDTKRRLSWSISAIKTRIIALKSFYVGYSGVRAREEFITLFNGS